MISAHLLLAVAQGPGTIPGLVTDPWVQLTSSSTGMVVEFITHNNPKITIETNGPSVRKIENMVLKTDDLQLQKFVIEGLKPNTEFSYTLVSGDKRVKYLAHAPKDANASAKLAIFGSSGLGSQVQKDLAAVMQKADPNLIIHVGDIVYPHGQEPGYLENYFGVYNSILSRTPVVAAAGPNDTTFRDFMDYPGGLAYYKFFNLPKNRYPWARDLGNFSFTYGNAFWLILDSNEYNNWKDARAQAWVKAELAKGAKMPWRFVAFHHSPWHSSKVRENDIQMRALDLLFQQAKVNVVFSGHVHNYQRSRPTNVGPYYIVTGAGGSELYDQDIAADKSQWKPFTQAFGTGFSFTQFEYSKTTASLKQIAVDGTVLDTLNLTSAPVVAPKPAPTTKKPTSKKSASKKKKGGG